MQIYSNGEPLQELERNRSGNLCGANRRSHLMIPSVKFRVAGCGLLVAAAIGCAPSAGHVQSGAGDPQPSTRAPISQAELDRDLHAFADDSMRGRETGTIDALRAAAFIGRRLAELGLEPVGDSLYYQRVPMARQVVTPATRIAVTRNGVSRPIRVGDEVAPMLSLGDGQPEPRHNVDAELVFAGYAITSKSAGRDDLSSIDLMNKVAVILHGAPPGVTGALRDSLNSDNELALQLARIALKQPAGIVVLMT